MISISQVKEPLIGLYDCLPWRIIYLTEPIIRGLKNVILFFSELKVDVFVLESTIGNENRSCNILYIGKRHQITFIKDFLGTHARVLRSCGSLFPWSIRSYIERPESETDLTILNINNLLCCFLNLRDYLHLPSFVRSVLDLSGSFEDVRTKLHENIRRSIRKIQGTQYTIKHDEKTLKHFYYNMYIPYIKDRFGERAFIIHYAKMKRLLKAGFLLVVQKEKSWLSGAICRVRNRQFVIELIGVEGGDVQLLRQGALDALYYYSIIIALEKGCEKINFGNSRPFLNTGLVQYKKKWGTQIYPDDKQYRKLAVRINTSRAMGYTFLAENYPIVHKKKELVGFVLNNAKDPISQKDMNHYERAFFHPGLERLIVLALSECPQEILENYSQTSGHRITLFPVDSKETLPAIMNQILT